jgi:eukaryotic-like serine/threonine-protein kinase
MKRLLPKLQRLAVWKVVAVYLAGGWTLYQVVLDLVQGVGLPPWLPVVALGLVILGLPLTVCTAVVYQALAFRDGAPAPAPGSGEAAAQKPPSLVTWSRAGIAGAAVVLLTLFVTTGYVGLRAAGVSRAAPLLSRPERAERERVLLGEFTAMAADSLLARAATEAFRTDLAQSRVLRVVTAVELAVAVRRMGWNPAERLPHDAVLELARREGIEIVMLGEILRVGAGFQVSARLVPADGGVALAAFRATASDSTRVIPAIDRLARQVRQRAGEPLGSIRGTPPLAQVTTPSLAALEKFTHAVRAAEIDGRTDKAILLIEEAIALDSAFASAHRYLGLLLHNVGADPARRLEALTRAYEYRERLPVAERYRVMGSYYRQVAGDLRAAVAAFETLLDLDPHSRVAGNLAINLWELGEFERAEAMAARALASDSSPPSVVNLSGFQAGRGNLSGAEATLAEGLRRFPGQPWLELQQTRLLAARGEYAKAERHLAEVLERGGIDAHTRRSMSGLFGALAAARGRLEEARGWYAAAARSSEQAGAPDLALAAELEWARVQTRTSTAAGTAGIEAVLRRYPMEPMPPLNRPYLLLTHAYAEAGRPDLAEATLAQRDSAVAPALLRASETYRQEAIAQIALARGDADAALAALGRAQARSCPDCLRLARALAHQLAGRPDSARVQYEAYLASTTIGKLEHDPLGTARAHLEMAALLEVSDPRAASAHYAAFLSLWEQADAALEQTLAGARRRLAALASDTGAQASRR